MWRGQIRQRVGGAFPASRGTRALNSFGTILFDGTHELEPHLGSAGASSGLQELGTTEQLTCYVELNIAQVKRGGVKH